MEIKNIKTRYDGYLHMYEIEYENSEGEKRSYDTVSRQKGLDKEHMGEKIDGVMIVPIVGNKVLLSREFRIPVNRYIYNFPAGLIDSGETVAQAAVRELREETGLEAEHILFTLPPAFSSAGMTDERVAVVFVKAKGEIIGSDNINEDITSELYTKEELKEILESTSDICSKTQLVCLYLLLAEGTV